MSPEQIGILAFFGLALVGCWRLIKWFGDAERTPDPWDLQTEERLHQPDAVPVCTRCLEGYEPTERFCPTCGLPVDGLILLSPYLYVFALGDVLVTGTRRTF